LIASGCKNLLESGISGQFIFGGWCDFNQTIDNVVGRDAVTLSSKVYDEPMAKDRRGQRLNIFRRDVSSTVKESTGLPAKNEKLDCARTGAPAHHFADEFGSSLFADSRLSHQ
jgi:hypothetical protein